MRRIISCTLCLLILLLSMPGAAVASEDAKKQFIRNYMNILDKSFKIQSSYMDSMKRNTISFNFDGELTESSYQDSEGDTKSVVPCRGSLEIISKQKDGKAQITLEGQVMEYSLDAKAYISPDGIIIPRKTLETLAQFDSAYKDEFQDMPAYLVLKPFLSEEESALFQEMLTYNMDIYNKTEQIQEFCRAVLNTIPADYFSFKDCDTVLEIKPSMLGSARFIGNLKSNSRDLAEKFTAIMSKPPYLSDEEYEELKEIMIESFVEGIDSLQLSDLADLELPFTVDEFMITARADRLETSVHFSYDDTDGKVDLKMSGITELGINNSYTSLVDMAFLADCPDFFMDLNLQGKATADARKSNMDIELAGSIKTEEESLSGKIVLKTKMDYKSEARIILPELNEDNSMVMDITDILPYRGEWDDYDWDDYRWDEYDDGAVKVYIYGYPMYFEDSQPVIINSRALLPLRETTDYLGGEVSWQPPDTVVLGNGYEEDLVLKINSTTYYQGEQALTMSTAPVIIDGRTYVPVRLVAEYLGYTVEWDESSQSIFIN